MAVYRTLERYDLVLMIDVVEHLPKSDVLLLLKHFLAQGSACLIATPRHFFQQELFESHWERHCSHWTAKDFRGIGHLESQSTRSSRIFLLSPVGKPIVGFGDSVRQRVKRIIWALLSER
jgi:hypothetical protein